MRLTQPLLSRPNDAPPPGHHRGYAERALEGFSANYIVRLMTLCILQFFFFVTAVITTISIAPSISDSDQPVSRVLSRLLRCIHANLTYQSANPLPKASPLLVVFAVVFLLISTLFWIGHLFLVAHNWGATTSKYGGWAEVAFSIMGKLVFVLVVAESPWCHCHFCPDWEIPHLPLALSITQAWWDFALVVLYRSAMMDYLDRANQRRLDCRFLPSPADACSEP